MLEYCKWESEGGVGGGGGEGGGGESDFSNKCWHQACLILESGNSLICYRLWNSSGVLQRGRPATTTAQRAPGSQGGCPAMKPRRSSWFAGFLPECLPVALLRPLHYQQSNATEKETSGMNKWSAPHNNILILYKYTTWRRVYEQSGRNHLSNSPICAEEVAYWATSPPGFLLVLQMARQSLQTIEQGKMAQMYFFYE